MHIHLKVMFAMCRVLLERTLVFAKQTSQLFVVPPQQISMFLEDHFVFSVQERVLIIVKNKNKKFCQKKNLIIAGLFGSLDPHVNGNCVIFRRSQGISSIHTLPSRDRAVCLYEFLLSQAKYKRR